VEELRKNEFLLSDPMVFDVDNRGAATQIVLGYYLPVQLVQHNEVVLNSKDILYFTTPTEDFAEYYENSVDKLKRMEAEGELENEVQGNLQDRIKSLIVQAFESMEPEERTIH
jgi:uncharacterized protein YfaA (DUF2138 family)